MLRVFHGFECATNQDMFEQMLTLRGKLPDENSRREKGRLDTRAEIDDFDRDDTIYLMSVDSRKHVLGSVRLLSTIGPHLLSGPLSETFPGACFSAPRIWEASRFVFTEGKGGDMQTALAAAREIFLGLHAITREHRVERILAIYGQTAASTLHICGLPYWASGNAGESGTIFVSLWDVAQLPEASIAAANAFDAARAKASGLEAA